MVSNSPKAASKTRMSRRKRSARGLPSAMGAFVKWLPTYGLLYFSHLHRQPSIAPTSYPREPLSNRWICQFNCHAA